MLKKVMKVDLRPYRNLEDLVMNGCPDVSLIQRVNGKLKEFEQRRDLKQAIYGPDADLGDDDVMKSNHKDAVFARQMVEDMSRYIQFPDDQDKDGPESTRP